MQISLSFTRVLFLSLCVLFFSTYALEFQMNQPQWIKLLIGMVTGIIFGTAVITLDPLFKKFNLRAFNIAILGLLFGYLMGEAILLIFQKMVQFSSLNLNDQSLELIKACLFLLTTYLGMIMTIRASDELYVSLPFIKFKPSSQKKKDLILDSSILLDPRLIDLANSGLLDYHLIVPRFLIKESYEMCESFDENIRLKGRRILEVVKKLEGIPNLHMRFTDADFPEYKDLFSKLIRLARLLDANILSADSNRTQQSHFDGVLIINIHILSFALKPLAQTGEFINIKIQRYGKEARQGVGYLEDGTMVVVNGGAEYIGETIRVQVLSVKHTSSGRMIFSNVLEGETESVPSMSCSQPDADASSPKNYFAL